MTKRMPTSVSLEERTIRRMKWPPRVRQVLTRIFITYGVEAMKETVRDQSDAHHHTCSRDKENN